MEEIEVGQQYMAQPMFTDFLVGNTNGPRQRPWLTGRVIHVNRRANCVTLEFDVRMGKIRETICATELGKRIQ